MNSSELDIRWPIGLLFLVLGALIALYGAVTPQHTHVEGSFNVNLNLVWGVVMVFFGLLMTWGARRASRRDAVAAGKEQAVRHRG